MERELFTRRLLEAAVSARDFARTFIEEPLPDAMRFRVQLNSSHDANASPDFKLYPEDSSPERARAHHDLSANEVVDLLWRDGLVPQWIDVQVVDERGDFTLLEILACGRFIADESRLYYTWTEIAPFGPKGPTLPVDYVEGQRFSIHDRASCSSPADLERLRAHASKVSFLTLDGPAFDDAVLATGLDFVKVSVLEIAGAPLRGDGLAGLRGLPRLRHLRATLVDVESFDLQGLSVMEALESLSIQSLPSELRGARRLADALPGLQELALGSTSRTRADAPIALPGVKRLTLAFPNLPGWVHPSSSLRDLSIHAQQADDADADVTRFLAGCPAALETLSLSRTPVTDAILAHLERFERLQYLGVAETNVSPAALERFAAARPKLRYAPRKPKPPLV